MLKGTNSRFYRVGLDQALHPFILGGHLNAYRAPQEEKEGDVAAKCIKMTRVERERERERGRERERWARDAEERGEILLCGSRSNVVAGKVSSRAEFYIFRANKAEQGR